MELKEIGKIHSPYKTVKEAPRQGKISDKFCEIEIFPAYEAHCFMRMKGNIMWFYILPTKLTARPCKQCRPGQRNLTAYLPAVRRTGRIPSIYAWSNW